MCHYKHLILSEREKILYFQAKNYSITAIANAVGRDKSTISRKLRQNTEEEQYLPASAQQLYKSCRVACKPHKRLENKELYDFVRDRFLNHQWSPEETC